MTVYYNDEIILQKREEIKKQRYNNLEKGYYIGGKILQFVRQNMFDKFSIIMPDTMRIMPQEVARIKYPSEFRPEKIYTTIDLTVNLGFSILWDKLEVKNTGKIAERMKNAIGKFNPDIRFYETIGVKNNGCQFAFRSHAMDTDLYNMILLMPIGDSVIQSSFNCLFQQSKDWKKVIKLMWHSIEKIEKKEI